MNKYRLGLLSSVMALSLCATPFITVQAANNTQDNATKTESVKKGSYQKGKVKYYGKTKLRYYPNHVIVAEGVDVADYNRQIVRDIVGLSLLLGWDTVYVQFPSGLRAYANDYFSENNLNINYIGLDLNPAYTGGFFYGGAAYYGHRHGYHGGHRHGDHHGHHHGGGHHHGSHHHGGSSHHSGGHHGGGHHGGGHHGGGHHGSGHHGGGHHGGGHHGGGHHGGGHHGGGHHGGGHHGGGHHGGGHHR